MTGDTEALAANPVRPAHAGDTPSEAAGRASGDPAPSDGVLRARADGWAATLAAGYEPDLEEAAEIGKLLSDLSDALARA